jgi:hypothetical protein
MDWEWRDRGLDHLRCKSRWRDGPRPGFHHVVHAVFRDVRGWPWPCHLGTSARALPWFLRVVPLPIDPVGIHPDALPPGAVGRRLRLVRGRIVVCLFDVFLVAGQDDTDGLIRDGVATDALNAGPFVLDGRWPVEIDEETDDAVTEEGGRDEDDEDQQDAELARAKRPGERKRKV